MLDSVVQLISVLLIFVFVVVLAYFATKLTARLQQGKYQNANVEIIETYKSSPTQYIQVVRVGKRYYAYVACKENATLLGELLEDDIIQAEKKPERTAVKGFQEILDKLKKG